MVAQFVDISSFQGEIDFSLYCPWARQWDGVARIAMKATEGVGFTDPNFRANRTAAMEAGIDEIYFYHFSRPDLGNSPVAEANFIQSVVGAIRNSDMIILDYEVQSPLATATWALAWLVEFGPKYGKLPGIYASSTYILERLQWPGLDAFPLWLAKWEFTPDERPACPPPWTSYEFIQYTDRATNIPGIASAVDADIFLGGTLPMATTVPNGWTDDGQTLTAPNHIPVVLGFRDHVLSNDWDPANWPLAQEEHLDILEQSNPALGGGQSQIFRWKRLEYTDKEGILEGWMGQELLWYQQQFELAQQQIAALEKQIAALNGLPSMANLLAVNALAAQIVQKTQVQ